MWFPHLAASINSRCQNRHLRRYTIWGIDTNLSCKHIDSGQYFHPEFIYTNSTHLLNCSSLISTLFIPIKSAPFHADKAL